MVLMTDRDAAFLWETEAMRTTRARTRTPVDPPVESGPRAQGWRTIRQAHDSTGIPIGTLRKWARLGAVPSYLDASRDQSTRMVKMDAGKARAASQGRTIAPVIEDAQDIVVDLREGPTDPAPVSRDGVEAPPGTMIVPIAAWDKMLMQLGNLHEAGQQLAEARERAAKAETESVFLRERLAELRREGSGTPPADGAPSHPVERVAERTFVTPGPPPPSRATQMWRVMYRSWRSRRRR